MFENGPRSGSLDVVGAPLQLSTASISGRRHIGRTEARRDVPFGRQVVIVDVPPHRRCAREVAPRERVVDGEVLCQPRPVVGQRDRRPAVTGEVVAERERALDLDLDQPVLERVAPRAGDRVEDPVTLRIAEVRTRDFGDRRSLILQPDHEELVLIERVPAEQDRQVGVVDGHLVDRETRLLRGDLEREAEPAGRELAGDVVDDHRAGMGLVDARPIFDRGSRVERQVEPLNIGLAPAVRKAETLHDLDGLTGPGHVRNVRGLWVRRTADCSLPAAAEPTPIVSAAIAATAAASAKLMRRRILPPLSIPLSYSNFRSSVVARSCERYDEGWCLTNPPFRPFNRPATLGGRQ